MWKFSALRRRLSRYSLIGRLLSCPLVGKGLPLAVDRDRNRVVRLLARLHVRRWFGRWWVPARLCAAVPPPRHRADGSVLRGRRPPARNGTPVSSAVGSSVGLAVSIGFFDSGISGNSRFGLLPPKAVQLTGIQPAQQGARPHPSGRTAWPAAFRPHPGTSNSTPSDVVR